MKKDEELKVIEESISELKIDNNELKELKDKFEVNYFCFISRLKF